MQHNHSTRIPTLSDTNITRLCAQYLKLRYKFELSRRSSQPIGIAMELPSTPIMLPVKLKLELDSIAKILTDAFLNRGK